MTRYDVEYNFELIKKFGHWERIPMNMKAFSNKEDAEILSFFYNDENTILNISKDDDFIASKEITLNALKKISDHKEFIFEIEVNVIPSLKTKEEIRFFFDFMIIFFKVNSCLDNRKNRSINLLFCDSAFTLSSCLYNFSCRIKSWIWHLYI